MSDELNSAGAGTHEAVLLEEAVHAMGVEATDTVVDCTFGRGGHSRALLERLGPSGRLIGLDRDPSACTVGKQLAQQDGRFEMVHACFADLGSVLEVRGLEGAVNAVLMDLGVSSPQLDDPERGFSFREDGPLDMRMDSTAGPSAADWLATVEEAELARVLRDFSDERLARRIARAIVRRRAREPFTRTADLAGTVAACYPRSRRPREASKHPATRTFQAIRIRVNEELAQLSDALEQMPRLLAAGGRLVVISFHSLEDRLVKRFMRRMSTWPELPRGLPPPPDMAPPPFERMARAVRAGDAELIRNPRARSAVLRTVQVRS